MSGNKNNEPTVSLFKHINTSFLMPWRNDESHRVFWKPFMEKTAIRPLLLSGRVALDTPKEIRGERSLRDRGYEPMIDRTFQRSRYAL